MLYYLRPLVFLLIQENYKPNGWLDLQLGSSAGIPAWNLQVLEENFRLLLDKTKTLLNTLPAPKATEPIKQSRSEVSSAALNTDMVQALNTKIEAMSEKLDMLTQMMAVLSSNVEEIKNQLKQEDDIV